MEKDKLKVFKEITDQDFGNSIIMYLGMVKNMYVQDCYIRGSTVKIPEKISFLYIDSIISKVDTIEKNFVPGQNVIFTFDEILLAITNQQCQKELIPFKGNQIISCSLPWSPCIGFKINDLHDEKSCHEFHLKVPL